MIMTPVTITKDATWNRVYKVKDAIGDTLGIYTSSPKGIILHYTWDGALDNWYHNNKKYKSIEEMLERNDWQLTDGSETQRK